MITTPLFSFIIVNFKSAHLISLWLKAFSRVKLSPNEYEVIIVNNDHSETLALETLAQGFHFKLIHAPDNRGFGTGCNLGGSNASGAILLFVNPDTQFLSGDFYHLARLFENDPSLGIVGLKLLSSPTNPQAWSVGSEVTLTDTLRNHLVQPKSKALWESTTPVTVAWVSGASICIPAQLFADIKGFDEEFFMYFEDTDLCKRVSLQGKTILSYPHIQWLHTGGQSALSHRIKKQSYYASQKKFFSKHRPKWEQYCLAVLHTFFIH
jgi:GT2 family glycosyltransferase